MITRVAIIDDHKLFRKSFELLISQIQGVEVVFMASNGLDLIEVLESKTVVIDLVFLDIQMPKMDGYQTAAILTKKYPEIKILILTSYNDVYSVIRMLDYNIAGYLTKNTKPKDIRNAILTVRESGVYFDKNITTSLKDLDLDMNQKPLLVTLSDRELELIKLFAKQYNGREIADKLSISFRTVEKHKEILMQKTQSYNFIGVIMYAFLRHYIDESDFIRPSKK
ncbi:response regulator transcription factor [Myroides marinus]|uniref:response regulator transcription factor n=1 Tax=Myroides marinus TaxID=703342 RepID=UPI001A978FA2|nr:response regulator transcription factor [Myroides marinus]